MKHCNIVSITGNCYTLVDLEDHGLALRQTSHGSGNAIPIVPLGGPYRCPFHHRDHVACECITKSPILAAVDLNADLASVPPLHCKKYFVNYYRQLHVCTNPAPALRLPEIRTHSGHPVFLVEAGCYHFYDKGLRGLPARCLICSNKVTQNPHSIIWAVAEKRSSWIDAAMCLRCNSKMRFGHVSRTQAAFAKLAHVRRRYQD